MSPGGDRKEANPDAGRRQNDEPLRLAPIRTRVLGGTHGAVAARKLTADGTGRGTDDEQGWLVAPGTIELQAWTIWNSSFVACLTVFLAQFPAKVGKDVFALLHADGQLVE
jgi:hypothetical protein